MTLSAPPDPATGLPAIDRASSLAGRLSGSTRLGVLNYMLAARGDRVDGTITADLTLSGNLADLHLRGRLDLAGAATVTRWRASRWTISACV